MLAIGARVILAAIAGVATVSKSVAQLPSFPYDLKHEKIVIRTPSPSTMKSFEAKDITGQIYEAMWPSYAPKVLFTFLAAKPSSIGGKWRILRQSADELDSFVRSYVGGLGGTIYSMHSGSEGINPRRTGITFSFTLVESDVQVYGKGFAFVDGFEIIAFVVAATEEGPLLANICYSRFLGASDYFKPKPIE